MAPSLPLPSPEGLQARSLLPQLFEESLADTSPERSVGLACCDCRLGISCPGWAPNPFPGPPTQLLSSPPAVCWNVVLEQVGARGLQQGDRAPPLQPLGWLSGDCRVLPQERGRQAGAPSACSECVYSIALGLASQKDVVVSKTTSDCWHTLCGARGRTWVCLLSDQCSSPCALSTP